MVVFEIVHAVDALAYELHNPSGRCVRIADVEMQLDRK
jgi:hypothetical protein